MRKINKLSLRKITTHLLLFFFYKKEVESNFEEKTEMKRKICTKNREKR